MSKTFGKGSRQRKKKCVKPTAFPCGFACIARRLPNGEEKICHNVLHGQAETFSLWLKDTEERLAKINANRTKKGKDLIALTDNQLGFKRVKNPVERVAEVVDDLTSNIHTVKTKSGDRAKVGSPIHSQVKTAEVVDDLTSNIHTVKTKSGDRAKVGSPIHSQVKTVEDAISNGKAIAGEWISRLAISGKRLTEINNRIRELEKSSRGGWFRRGNSGDKAELSRLEKEKKKIESDAETFVRELIQSSSLSQEKAVELISKISLPKNITAKDYSAIINFTRLTNGQALETLKEIVYVPSSKRAETSIKDGKIFVSKDSRGDLWHEMGHHVEYLIHNRRSRIGYEFIKKRASGKAISLNNMMESVGGRSIKRFQYGDEEVAFPDEFVDPYVGKLYFNGTSEVLSMGMESLISTKKLIDLASKDPEHLMLVIGIAQQRHEESFVNDRMKVTS